jgi:DNA-binding CsgD family transcriptional regulator
MTIDDHTHLDGLGDDRIGTPLTEREREVCRLIAAGCTTRQAATELFISPKTVEFHLGRAYRKLAVSNRAQLTRAVIAGIETGVS